MPTFLRFYDHSEFLIQSRSLNHVRNMQNSIETSCNFAPSLGRLCLNRKQRGLFFYVIRFLYTKF